MKKIFIIMALLFCTFIIGCGSEETRKNENPNGVIDWNDLNPDKNKEPSSDDNKEENKENNPQGNLEDNPNENPNQDPPEENPNENPPEENPNENPPEENPNPVDDSIKEIKVNFDYTKYTATVNDVDLEIEVSHDSQYAYEWFTVKAINGKKFNSNIKLYVNDEEKTLRDVFELYQLTLNEELTELTYKIKDPNWTPIY